jgi:hypothetical protein
MCWIYIRCPEWSSEDDTLVLKHVGVFYSSYERILFSAFFWLM